MKNIGGFFPLHLSEDIKTSGFLSLWNTTHSPHLFFANGRSALYHIILLRKPKTVWLPAYSCTALAEAVQATDAEVRFFPVLPTLSPDVKHLKTHVKQGDAVLGIDYFGRNPEPEFLEFVLSSPHITWIEDRAQALLPSPTSWGDYILYSPRKLMGVPDGGILVSKQEALPAIKQPWNNSCDFIDAALLRFEDKQETHNNVWYERHVEYEKTIKVSTHSMSRLSRFILSSTDPAPFIKARTDNYAYLMSALEDIALLPPKDKSFVPFGFPVRVAQRHKLMKFLHSNKIFAAHHWPELPSDAASFPFEHSLSAQLLTLPVDQRYSVSDMKQVATLVREALS